MGKLIKQKPKKHVVVVDTNILWHADKSFTVNPDFDGFWDEHTSITDLELYIPEVVRGELLFQQTDFAWTLYDKAENALKMASSVTNKQISIRIKRETLSGHVERKLDTWINRRKAIVIKTPRLNKEKWETLIDNSIWGMPPFETDPKNKRNEKGFRDALILETLLWIVENEKRDVQIVFISGDNLLRDTAIKTILGKYKCSFFETLEDFSSHIRMIHQEKDKAFVDDILPKATAKFFTKGDFECVYYKYGVRDILQKEYKSYIDDPESIITSNTETLGNFDKWLNSQALNVGETLFGGSKRKWVSQNEGTYWINRTQFDRIEEGRNYYWKTKVTYIELFKRDMATLVYPLLSNIYQILILPCTIYWKSEVRKDGRFFGTEFIEIKYSLGAFKEPTEDDMKTYRLSKYMSEE